MPIRTEEDLAQAIQEFHRLRDAGDDTPDGRRRAELDAEIKAFTMQHGTEMRKGKPNE